ncbi:MAG: transglycosylase SLT domain-containing protein [Prochloraceae cyanobacterium]|nr:transglycosylase SLT domain-containing protein [Prochloraceae cyanobacterium]
MKKDTTQKTPFLFSSALALLLLGSAVLFLPIFRQSYREEENNSNNKVLTLISLSPQQRQSQLETFVNKNKSISRNRARYLLAKDAIAQKNGQLALKYLQNLDRDYPLLAAPILLQKGIAYQLEGKDKTAIKIWEKLIKQHRDSPMVVEAIYLLGQSDVQYWQSYRDKIIGFYNHPRSKEIVDRLLVKNLDSLDLLLALVKSDPQDNRTRERLINDFSDRLTPENWQAIADGYWQQGQYKKAAETYINATHSGRNAYRIARGLHLSKQTEQAKKLYQSYLNEFPDRRRERGLALKHLASLSSDRESLKYLDILIAEFPEQAAKNSLEKVKKLNRLKENQKAEKIKESLAEKYPDSQIVARSRWQQAREFAANRDLEKAIAKAKEIVAQNQDSYLVPKASFWSGKWSQELGNSQEAKAAFESVLKNYPQSYYAWRSAVHLGWDVGNFTSVIHLEPAIVKPPTRSLPPAGSDTFKELYLLGQDRDAWNYFLVEIKSKLELNVQEKFTEGLLNVTRGNYQLGTYQIWSLQNRAEPQERQEWKALRETPLYWQTLFPFAYEETILNWSEKRQINPILVTSLIRRESRFQESVKSVAGATGLMQIMPATGKWIANKIELENYSLTDPEDNVNLGTWYVQHTHEIYNNNSLLAIASYNAGPGNVRKWINRYGFADQDTFVEQIPFPETEGYVKAVFGGYWNYLRIYNPEVSQLLSDRSGAEIE